MIIQKNTWDCGRGASAFRFPAAGGLSWLCGSLDPGRGSLLPVFTAEFSISLFEGVMFFTSYNAFRVFCKKILTAVMIQVSPLVLIFVYTW